MIGITGYSVYVPRHRLRRELLAQAWGGRAPPGTKAVMHYDEDPLTMGQAAAWRLVAAGERPDALWFASTSAPYWQRSSASLIAAACDLPRETASADFGASLRCGMTALGAALNAVAAGSRRSALVVAAEGRDAAPESPEEAAFGDAAAALAVGSEGVLAEPVAAVSRSDDFPDEWRRDIDGEVHSFASKYSTTRGYLANVVAVGRALLEHAGIAADQIARAAFPSSDGRAQLEAARALGIAPERVEDSRAAEIGVTGAAMPFLLLAHALDGSRPGDLVLSIGYGDGADGLLMRVTSALRASRLEADSRWLEYPSYSIYRKLRQAQRAASGPEVSGVLLHREEPQNVRLHGSLCLRCGAMQFPISKICAACRNACGLVEKPLARKGTLFTFTRDFLYDAPVQPTVMAVVDLDGGGRFLCQMTDVAPEAVEIGMPVELVLRRMREGAADHHYYWKCRPL